MYLHLGQDTVVRTDEIIGIYDLDTSTVSKWSREYLTKAQKSGRVVTVSSELPKSFIVCECGKTQTVYISQLSAQTLVKRLKDDAMTISKEGIK